MQENALIRYFKDSLQELHKVSWPTKNQAVRLTLIVIGFSIAVAIFIGVVDYIFTFAYSYLIKTVHG